MKVSKIPYLRGVSKFIVSARKYRPVRFDEVVGQQHVSQTLKNALQTDHLAHAFLFCGPRGVGKTTNARILAKVLNCENRTEDFEPCNTCTSCVAFNDNASLNITELDAASNNSVEHIRALIEQVRFQPQHGEYKVFIIDEVHMLSQQAFNAFLKTLEEPPSYAIFILATTEKHKIIPTILSRCQIFDFKRIQLVDMIAHLQEICDKEGIQADPDALHIIAQKADGALRDALSIFDRMTAFSGKEITYDAVIENLNVLDYDYFFRAVDQILTEDRAGLMLLFDEVLNKGFDSDLFINGMAGHLRNLLVCKDVATIPLLEAGERLKERYHQQSALAPTDMLLTALNLANDCDINFKLARNKRLHVEMSLLKMASMRRAFSLKELPSSAAPAAGPEKKTADVTENRPIAPTYEEKKGEAAPPEVALALEAKAHAAPELTSPSSLLVGASSLQLGSLNTDALMNEIKAQAASDGAVAAVEVLPLTQELLEKHWDAFLAKEGGSTMGLMMKQANVRIEDDEIVVSVGSQRYAAALRDDTRLVIYLRDKLGRPGLSMRQEADESLKDQAPAPKKRLTPKDKYLEMRAKNPALDDLRKRFDLRPEE